MDSFFRKRRLIVSVWTESDDVIDRVQSSRSAFSHVKNQHGGQTCVVATRTSFKPDIMHTVAFNVVESSSGLCEDAFRASLSVENKGCKACRKI